jgi:hypothetical protein
MDGNPGAALRRVRPRCLVITSLLLSLVLMALCVVIHAAGTMAALRWLNQSPSLASRGLWRPTWLLVRVAAWLFALHLLEVALWGVLYAAGRAFADVRSAIYFSSVTYTTVGYGDLVLPAAWRLVGGVEALTGILMCGWSTGAFFALVTRMARANAAAPGA